MESGRRLLGWHVRARFATVEGWRSDRVGTALEDSPGGDRHESSGDGGGIGRTSGVVWGPGSRLDASAIVGGEADGARSVACIARWKHRDEDDDVEMIGDQPYTTYLRLAYRAKARIFRRAMRSSKAALPRRRRGWCKDSRLQTPSDFRSQHFFRPSGACLNFLIEPTACAVG